jgi:hypothetical protein
MDLPPVNAVKQDAPEQKVERQNVSEITEELLQRPSPEQKISMIKCPFCTSEIQEKAIFCRHCFNTLPASKVTKQNISEPRVLSLEVSKTNAEPPPRPSIPKRTSGKHHVEKSETKAITLYQAVITVIIIILLAGIFLTITNMGKREKQSSVATPKIETPSDQQASAPAPVQNQQTSQPSKEDLERIAKENRLNTIRNAHPDFDNLRDSGKIVAWIQKQPRYLRESLLNTYNEGSADSVIALINQFKKDEKNTRLRKDAVKIPKKDISAAKRPVASEQKYTAIKGGVKGIELNDGNVIEGQIISFQGETVKIRTKDGKISTYSFMKEIKSFIY